MSITICHNTACGTWLTRDKAGELVTRYSERIERAGKKAAALRSIAEVQTG